MSDMSDTLTGTRNITSEVSSSAVTDTTAVTVRDKATMSQTSTHQMEPSAAVSAGPSAGDLTEERVTLKSALYAH